MTPQRLKEPADVAAFLAGFSDMDEASEESEESDDKSSD
jgi:hypothetical protein